MTLYLPSRRVTALLLAALPRRLLDVDGCVSKRTVPLSLLLVAIVVIVIIFVAVSSSSLLFLQLSECRNLIYFDHDLTHLIF
jgi:hypothetical protein